jgi:uncharacterized tellurite resistance protein B-like protein
LFFLHIYKGDPKLFNFFKKNDSIEANNEYLFDHELIGCALAYEVAISDGELDESELASLKTEIIKKSEQLKLDSDEVLRTIEHYSSESISFNDFINQINENFDKDQKLKMVEFLWQTAYADNILEVDEERLIRRISDMIRLKNMEVLKLKDKIRKIKSI